MSQTEFDLIVYAWIAIALIVVPGQLRLTAPYGRHHRTGFGPTMPNRLGWLVMEIVSPLAFAIPFLAGGTTKTAPMWVMFALWMAHYTNRSVVFPLRTRTRGKEIPLLIVASAIFFNLVNGGLNGIWLGSFSAPYPASWFVDVRFLVGLALFIAGAAINIDADNRLIALRAPGGTDYVVPRGGLFRYVSCPNHLGEIVEWTGFAVLCWNLPALSFAVWTAANLVPRALSHHRWYHARFRDYSKDRRAIIPFLL